MEDDMMSLTAIARRSAIGLAAGTAIALAAPASAQVSFEGETINWIIPFSEGGGSDKWARFYAPLLSEALPGKPVIVIKNMPGAGSTKGANFFADRAKPDGLTVLGTSGSTQFPYLLGDPRVKFDYADWHVVLASATGGVAYLPKELADQWAADPQAVIDGTDFIYGSQGATRLDLVPLLAWELLGMRVDPVFGIKGRGDGRLMFERGEANIDYQTSSAFLSKVTPLVEQGLARSDLPGHPDLQGSLYPDQGGGAVGTRMGCLEGLFHRRLSGPENGVLAEGHLGGDRRGLFKGLHRGDPTSRFRRGLGQAPRRLSPVDRGRRGQAAEAGNCRRSGGDRLDQELAQGTLRRRIELIGRAPASTAVEPRPPWTSSLLLYPP
jgi:hypothetical protein